MDPKGYSSCVSPKVKSPIDSKRAAMRNIAIMALIVLATHYALSWFSGPNNHLYWFMALFLWRYTRFIVNFFAFWLYRPSVYKTGKTQPIYTNKDVTVVLPTIDPEGDYFWECVLSCAHNRPTEIIIVTAGDQLWEKTKNVVVRLREEFKDVRFRVLSTQVASKREQVAEAIPHVKTAITVLVDDHVFWGPRFLSELLCPFSENPNVGLVGTNKRVRRLEGLSLWARFWNMLGAIYLIRHNFEIRSSNTVDGGVFVVSARTCALRTRIVQSPEFLSGYTNERFLFGALGPLNADDDNYCTRFVVNHGWDIKIQYTDDAAIETTIGVDHPIARKFLGQCRRWSRTTWRSNSASLFTERTVWARQPYCVYAVFLTSFTNFAAVVDPALVYLL